MDQEDCDKAAEAAADDYHHQLEIDKLKAPLRILLGMYESQGSFVFGRRTAKLIKEALGEQTDC